jgi:uncharacterized membrane protein
VPYIDPRFDAIEHWGIYASILTVFTGLFFIQSDVKGNNDAMFVLFLIVLTFNILFVSIWIMRFSVVIFRTKLSKL